MKEKICNHEWVIIRKTIPYEKRVNNQDYFVQCKHCKKTAYCNQRDIDWLILNGMVVK